MGSWSGLRKQLRERLAEALRKRLDFHYTVYSGQDRHGLGHPHHWSFWITIDGEEKLRLGCCGPVLYMSSETGDDQASAPFGPDQALQAIRQYLQLPIDDALCSRNPLIRGLALADARVGQRRLADLAPSDDAHELEKLFYAIRIGECRERIKTQKLRAPSIDQTLGNNDDCGGPDKLD